jgi:hypothetical protein
MTTGLVAHAPEPRRWRPWIAVVAVAAITFATSGHEAAECVTVSSPPRAEPPAPAPAPLPGLVSEPRDPWANTDAFFVQIVDGRVYWSGNHGLSSAEKDGSGRRRHVAGWVLTFQVEGEHVTYTTDRAVMRARLDGRGAPVVVSAERDDPIELASDGTSVYYTMFASREVRRVAWDGGRARRFARGGPSWTIALDATHLYVAEYGRGRVVKVPKRGGPAVVLARGLRRPVGITLDGDTVYIACEGDGSVRRVAKRGGRVTTLSTGHANNDILAVDDTHVYFADWNSQALMRAPKDGSAPATVAMPGLHAIVGIAVDDTHVALTSNGRRVIVLAKDRLAPTSRTAAPRGRRYR